MDDYTERVTAIEARDRYGIPRHRTNLWDHRGTIRAEGHRGRAKLYDLTELQRLNRLADLDPRSGPRA